MPIATSIKKNQLSLPGCKTIERTLEITINHKAPTNNGSNNKQKAISHVINSHVLTFINSCINKAIHVLLMHGFLLYAIIAIKHVFPATTPPSGPSITMYVNA